MKEALQQLMADFVVCLAHQLSEAIAGRDRLFFSRHELVDVNGAGRLDVDRFEVLVGDFDVAFALADLVPLDDAVCGHDVARLGIALLEMEAIARRFIELVEVNLLRLRRRWIEQNRA